MCQDQIWVLPSTALVSVTLGGFTFPNGFECTVVPAGPVVVVVVVVVVRSAGSISELIPVSSENVT
jgi:hypothetical protein